MKPIRKGTGKRIEDNIKRHFARMQELIAQGMPKDEASKQAYEELLRGKI